MIVKQLQDNLFEKKLGRPKTKESIQKSIQPKKVEIEEYEEFEEEEEEQVQKGSSNYGWYLIGIVLLVALGLFLAKKFRKDNSQPVPPPSASANDNGLYNPYQNFN